MRRIKRIAIMTGGGDCQGLNAVIRAAVKTGINEHELEILGVNDCYRGLVENDMKWFKFDDASNILTLGGTILGSSNKVNPFEYRVKKSDGSIIHKDVSRKCIKNLREYCVRDAIIIGGDGTMDSAVKFSKMGLNVIGVPKTIDNDLFGTERTFGFDTAVSIVTEAIDRIHSTAASHHRTMIIETMGRDAGWLALHSGVAGGADVILIPEIPYDLDKICQVIKNRSRKGKVTIIAVSEAAKEKGGKRVIHRLVEDSHEKVRLGGIGEKLARDIEERIDISARATKLGHVQRGGTPSASDRVFCTQLGYYAIQLFMKGKRNRLVVLKNGKISDIALSKTKGRTKRVRIDDITIKAARGTGVSFGD